MKKLFVSPRQDKTIIFVGALIMFAIYGIAWPLSAGRDLGTYILYFLDFWHQPAVFPMIMLFRTPGTALMSGLLLSTGPIIAEITLGVLYAAAILAVHTITRPYGRRTALIASLVVLVYPPFAALFHALSSDSLFAVVFLGWAAFITKRWGKHNIRTMATHAGWFIALLSIRPSTQLLFPLLAVLCFVPHREKAGRRIAVTFSLVLVACLAWTGHNYIRYNDAAIARGGKAIMPFYRVFTHDHLVTPANGPASQELGNLVATKLLTQEPYASYNSTTEHFFSVASEEMWSDLVWLVDQSRGWDTDYRLLQQVAFEAIRAHPLPYLMAMTRTLGAAFLINFTHDQSPPHTPTPSGVAPPNQPLPMTSHMWWLLSTPSGTTTVDWSDSGSPQVRLANPSLQQRYEQLGVKHTELLYKIPARSGNAKLGRLFNNVSRFYPPMFFWLILHVAYVWHRKQYRTPLTFIVACALLVIVVTYAGQPTVLHYRLVFDPLFITAGVIGGWRLWQNLKPILIFARKRLVNNL